MSLIFSLFKVSRTFIVLLLLSVAGISCRANRAYQSSFDQVENWGVGVNPDVEGKVANGVYEMFVKADSGIYWTVAGKPNLGNGVYEVEATQLSGSLDNGYGLAFKIDNEDDESDFYLFQVSGDGYVWIGWCEDSCQLVDTSLIAQGWIETSAVYTGINSSNTLRVEIDDDEMIFVVNGQEIGRVNDSRGGTNGDVGLTVETIGEGGVRVAFDNFRYTPLEE